MLTLGAVRGAAHMQDAVALADDDTVTVLAAYCRVRHVLQQPCGRLLGLWVTLRRPVRRWLARESSRAPPPYEDVALAANTAGQFGRR